MSEVRSTRFPLIKKSGLSTPGESRSGAIREHWFYFFMYIPLGSAAFLVLSARKGVLAREVEPSE